MRFILSIIFIFLIRLYGNCQIIDSYSKIISSKGDFDKHGNKTGFWIEITSVSYFFEGVDSSIFIEKGNYKKNKRQGLWIYSYKDSIMSFTIDKYFKNGYDTLVIYHYPFGGSCKEIKKENCHYFKRINFDIDSVVTDSMVKNRIGSKNYHKEYNKNGILTKLTESDTIVALDKSYDYSDLGVLISFKTTYYYNLATGEAYFEEYDKDSCLKATYTWSHKGLNGIHKFYYKNGYISESCNYINNSREGELLKYSKNGELIQKLIYKDDEIIK